MIIEREDPFNTCTNAPSFRLPLERFLPGWSLQHGKNVEALCTAPNALQTSEIRNDCLYVKACCSLREFEEQQGQRRLEYVLHLAGIVTQSHVKSLKMAPFARLSCFGREEKPGCERLAIGDQEMWVHAPPKPTNTQKSDKFIYIPFWWVETTSTKSQANVEWHDIKFKGVSFRVLQSIRFMDAGDRIFVFFRKTGKRDLQDAIVAQADAGTPGRRPSRARKN